MSDLIFLTAALASGALVGVLWLAVGIVTTALGRR